MAAAVHPLLYTHRVQVMGMGEASPPLPFADEELFEFLCSNSLHSKINTYPAIPFSHLTANKIRRIQILAFLNFKSKSWLRVATGRPMELTNKQRGEKKK